MSERRTCYYREAYSHTCSTTGVQAPEAAAGRAALASWASDAIPSEGRKLQVPALCPRLSPGLGQCSSCHLLPPHSLESISSGPTGTLLSLEVRERGTGVRFARTGRPAAVFTGRGGAWSQTCSYFVPQVHRLSTDFRAATRIVAERIPPAAELPPGASLIVLLLIVVWML